MLTSQRGDRIGGPPGGSAGPGNGSAVDPSEAVKSSCGGQVSPARRGTSNGNERGNNEARRRRREWLVTTYRADADLAVLGWSGSSMLLPVLPGTEGAQPACRCYRCGALLTADTLTVDRIIPGAHGGTYARTNIRPACGRCNASTGATVRKKR